MRILQPLCGSDAERRALIAEAFGLDTPLLYELDFSGVARVFLTNLLTYLRRYGEVAPGKSALVALLLAARNHVGYTEQTEIDALIVEMPQPRVVRHQRATPRWIGRGILKLLVLTLVLGGTAAIIEFVRDSKAVERNVDWTPQFQTFDGVEMARVPAGCFMMGSNNGDGDEQPVHQQCFDDPFWIDRYEVSQAQFRDFGGVKADANGFSGDQRPVENITWFEARDYCENKRPGDVRLPTEAQWEYAARGVDHLIYPWDNEFIAENVVYGGNSGNQTANVGNRRGGASWVGALDMSGNVWEWTSSIDAAYPYRAVDEREDIQYINNPRVQRGGSWDPTDNGVRAANRGRNSPDNWDISFGFRCVIS